WNPSPLNATARRLRSSFIETKPGVRTVHQQKPFRLPDGDGVWPGTRNHPGRWYQQRSPDDLRRIAVADLDRTRVGKLPRWHSCDADADPGGRAAVDKLSQPFSRVSASKNCTVSGFQSSASRCSVRRYFIRHALGRWRSACHELRSGHDGTRCEHARRREPKRDLACDVENVCCASDTWRRFGWLLDWHYVLSRCFRPDDAAGSAQRL